MKKAALDRRSFLVCASAFGLQLLSTAGAAAGAKAMADYDYPFVDYFDPALGAVTAEGHLFSPFGNVGAPESDLAAAIRITDAAPKSSPLDVLTYFSQIKDKGSTGERFNERWKSLGNPVIVRFFHDIGYVGEHYPDSDCTSWCAAAVSWALRRCGLPIPSEPTSSQRFISYGQPVNTPRPGDIVVFTNIKTPSLGHVGLYIGEDDSFITVLGGNQADTAAGPTDCGPGYPKSKVFARQFYLNPKRDPSVSSLFLNTIVRA